MPKECVAGARCQRPAIANRATRGGTNNRDNGYENRLVTRGANNLQKGARTIPARAAADDGFTRGAIECSSCDATGDVANTTRAHVATHAVDALSAGCTGYKFSISVRQAGRGGVRSTWRVHQASPAVGSTQCLLHARVRPRRKPPIYQLCEITRLEAGNALRRGNRAARDAPSPNRRVCALVCARACMCVCARLKSTHTSHDLPPPTRAVRT